MKRLLLVALMVLVTLVGMVGISRAQTSSAISTASGRNTFPPYPNKEEDEIGRAEALAGATAVSAVQATANATSGAVTELPATVNSGVPAEAKMYYLTSTLFTGGEASTACDSGFHMASLSEIQDTSKLQYAPRRTPADDPPRDSPVLDQTSDKFSDQFPEHTGWVRNEADPYSGLVRNCDGWTSSSDQQGGTTMTRRSLWGENGRSLNESDPAAWWQSSRVAPCSEPESVWCVEDSGEKSSQVR